MNIVLVTQGYPPASTDGIPRYNHTLANELRKQGHRVHIITREAEAKSSDPDIHYYSKTESVTSSGSELANNLASWSLSAYRVFELLAESEIIDVVVAPIWDIEGLAFVANPIAPLITTLVTPFKTVYATNPEICSAQDLQIIAELESYVVSNSSAVMPISNSILETFSRDYKIDFSTILHQIVPLGVEPIFDQHKISTEPSILYVGRLEPRKGIDILLKALPIVLEACPDTKVNIIGKQGYMAPNYEQEFGNRYPNVKFHGYLSDAKLSEIYGLSSIAVIPSRSESFGLTAIEAMGSGLAVVGSNTTGIAEIISDEINGLLFENGNYRELAAKLIKLIREPQTRQRLSSAAIETVHTLFSPELMTNEFLNLTNLAKAKQLKFKTSYKQLSELEELNNIAKNYIRFNRVKRFLGSGLNSKWVNKFRRAIS